MSILSHKLYNFEYLMNVQNSNLSHFLFNITVKQFEQVNTMAKLFINHILMSSIFIYTIISTNLLCQGDLSSYIPTSINTEGQLTKFFNSNQSCWYNQNGGQFQVKDRVLNSTIGKCFDLISTVPYVLCQNILLTENQTYEISFNLGNSQSINKSIISVTINGVSVMNLTAVGDYAFVTGNQIFRSFSNQSIICFKTSLISRSSSSFPSKGPLLANLTLTQYFKIPIPIPSAVEIKIELNWVMENEEYQNIHIKCDASSLQPQLRSLLKNKIKIYIEQQLQISVKIEQMEFGQLKVSIFPLKSYKLSNITISAPQLIFYQPNYYKFIFKVDRYYSTYVVQKQNQLNIIKTLNPFIEQMMSITHKVYIVLRLSFVSYFMASIISFWNLSLLYNLLNISSVPLFLKYFYENLLYKFFKLTSIIQWLTEVLPSLKNKLDFPNTLGSDQMACFKNNFGWFGYFGMSSQFLQNNFESLLILSILTIKLILINYLRKNLCFFQILRALLPKNLLQILSIFIKQLFMAIIFMAVSAGTNILSPGAVIFKEKVNSVLQYVALWMSIIIYPLFFIVRVKISLKKSIRKHRLVGKKQTEVKNCEQNQLQQKKKSKFYFESQQSKLERNKNKLMKKALYTLIQLLPYIVIPLIILFDSPVAFLTILTILIWTRCWWYLKNHRHLSHSRRKKVFCFLNLLIWFIHHHIYILFYCLQKIQDGFGQYIEQKQQQVIYEMIKICGYISIFTVLTGGLCEMMDFFLNMLTKIIFYLGVVVKSLKKSRIKPELQNKKVEGIKGQSNRKSKRGLITLFNKKQKKSEQIINFSGNKPIQELSMKNSPKKRNKIKLQSKLNNRGMLKIVG